MPFFADTNVCSKWESDPNVRQNWLAAKARLESEGHQYVSCSLVLIELLSRLIKPEPSYFSDDLKSFLFLNTAKRVLPFPAKFVLKTVLDINSPVSLFDSADFKNWLNCVVASPSRKTLSDGEVEMGSSLLTYGIDFGVIKRQHEAGQIAFVKRMTYLRARTQLPAWNEVALGILRNQEIIPQAGDAKKLTDALDAAFRYETFLLKTGTSYDFSAEKHRGDWIDSQLPYYLSDPDMHILTNDRRLKTRCHPSPQADRIIVL